MNFCKNGGWLKVFWRKYSLYTSAFFSIKNMPPNQASACHDCSYIPEKAKEEKVFLVKVFYRMRSHLFEIDLFKIYIDRSVRVKSR